MQGASAVHPIQHHQAAVLRGRIVPPRALNGLLALDRPQRRNEQDEIATRVLRLHGQYIGLASAAKAADTVRTVPAAASRTA